MTKDIQIEKSVLEAFSDALAICLPNIPEIKIKQNSVSFKTIPHYVQIFQKLSPLFSVSTDLEKLQIRLTPKDSKELKLLTNLLLVTRLNTEKLQDITRTTAFRKLSGQFSKSTDINFEPIYEIADAAKIIFETLEAKDMTQRELSESTGLSQVTLSSIKKGSSVKLDTFLQICKKLDLKLGIKK